MKTLCNVPSKELLQFLKEHRAGKESDLTWEEAADKANKKWGLVSRHGTPYTGIGFQCFVERATGKKKWGRQTQPFTKGCFVKKNKKPLGPVVFKAEPVVKPSEPKVVEKPKPAEPILLVKEPDALDLVKAVVGSDMNRSSKVYLVQKLVAALK